MGWGHGVNRFFDWGRDGFGTAGDSGKLFFVFDLDLFRKVSTRALNL